MQEEPGREGRKSSISPALIPPSTVPGTFLKKPWKIQNIHFYTWSSVTCLKI